VSSNGSAPALLEVENLVVRYPVSRGIAGSVTRQPRRWVHAVSGISFTLERGEMLALVGESGCGKTTTAQAILRLVDAEAGTVRFDGVEVTALKHRELRALRRRMQIVYQDPYESLDPRFRVRQTVEEPLVVHRIGSRSTRLASVEQALERAGLSPPELYLDRYPHELSGGQRQRVALAASLALEPELLVADEPVSMLDVSVRAGILNLLDELRRRGLGVLMITHDLSTAARFADRIAVMYLGRIVEEGPTRAVIDDPQHPYTKALLSVVPRRDPRQRVVSEILHGETPNPVDVPPGCRFHPRCPVVEARCREVDPALEPAGAAEGHSAACVLRGRTDAAAATSATDP
jgi:oligopeptide/dipeptide ABC transporter ATP-binding protein